MFNTFNIFNYPMHSLSILFNNTIESRISILYDLIKYPMPIVYKCLSDNEAQQLINELCETQNEVYSGVDIGLSTYLPFMNAFKKIYLFDDFAIVVL